MKIVLASLVLVFFGACGVDTSSSPSSDTNSDVQTVPTQVDSGLGALDVINPNPVVSDTNTTATDSNGTSSNTVDPISQQDILNSVFDTTGAIKDEQACIASNGYGALHDISTDSSVATDLDNGLEFSSLIPFGTNGEFAEGYEGTLYRTALKEIKSSSYTFILKENTYSITFDNSWVVNANNVVYVKMARVIAVDGSKPSCFRLKLDSLNSNEISEVKVFR